MAELGFVEDERPPTDASDAEEVWAESEDDGAAAVAEDPGLASCLAMFSTPYQSVPDDSQFPTPGSIGSISDNRVCSVSSGADYPVRTFWAEAPVVLTFLRRFG